MSVTSLAEVRPLVKTGLVDDVLQPVIDREEAMLAAEVGPLTGERTETFVIDEVTATFPVRLRRPAEVVTVTENGVATTDIRLGPDGRRVTRLLPTGWGPGSWLGVVAVTSTPNDEARIKTWVIELVRARLAETGFESETTQSYSYTRGDRSYDATFTAAVADVLGRKERTTSRGIRSTVASTASAGAWVGTVRP